MPILRRLFEAPILAGFRARVKRKDFLFCYRQAWKQGVRQGHRDGDDEMPKMTLTEIQIIADTFGYDVVIDGDKMQAHAYIGEDYSHSFALA